MSIMQKIREKIKEHKLGLALAGGLVALVAANKEKIGSALGEFAYQQELQTKAENPHYASATSINVDTYDSSNKKKEKDDEYQTVLIYDIDGEKNSNGELTADEVFIIKGDSVGMRAYNAIYTLSDKEWEHYVAQDVMKPLVSKKLNPMTDNQRLIYTAMMNYWQQQAKK